MNRRLYLVAFAALAVIAGLSVYVATKVQPKDLAGSNDLSVISGSVPTVAGAKGWINSPPLGTDALAGKVVLYDFWTYSCINCQRTLPHLKALYDHYKDDGLVVIGVHTPEFDFEKDHANVQRAVTELGVTWPVALDDDMAIWNAFGNRYWPEDYLTDRQGRLRDHHFGEGEYDSTEDAVRTLLGVPASTPRIETGPAPETSTPTQTPEIHFGVGFDGQEFNSSPQPLATGSHVFSAPQPVPQDTFALTGSWTADDQGVQSDDGNGSIVLRYRATEVDLVAGSGTGQPVNVVAELDGAPIGTFPVAAHDLYHVVAGGPSGAHTLVLRPAAGFQAFSFTFGTS